MWVFLAAVQAFTPSPNPADQCLNADNCMNNDMTFSTGLCHLNQNGGTAIHDAPDACTCKIRAREKCAYRKYSLNDDAPNCQKRNDIDWKETNKNTFETCAWDFDSSRTGHECTVYGLDHECEPPTKCSYTTVNKACDNNYISMTTSDDGVLSYCDCAIQFESMPSIVEWSFQASCALIDGTPKTNCCKFYDTCTRIADGNTVMRSDNSDLDRIGQADLSSANTARSAFKWRYNTTHVSASPSPPAQPDYYCSTAQKETLISGNLVKENQVCSGLNVPTGYLDATDWCDCFKQVHALSDADTTWQFYDASEDDGSESGSGSGDNECKYWTGIEVLCYPAPDLPTYVGHTPDRAVYCDSPCQDASNGVTREMCQLNGGDHYYEFPTTSNEAIKGTAVGCIFVVVQITPQGGSQYPGTLHMWFDPADANSGVSNASPLPDFGGTVLTQGNSEAEILAGYPIRRACHYCGTSTTTTTSSTTSTLTGSTSTTTTSTSTSSTSSSSSTSSLTSVNCEDVDLDVMRDEGWLLNHYGCSNAADETITSVNLCTCAGYANNMQRSFMFEPDDNTVSTICNNCLQGEDFSPCKQWCSSSNYCGHTSSFQLGTDCRGDFAANVLGTCYLYNDMCELVPQHGSSASNRNLRGCHHGCRDQTLPAVRRAQCDNGQAIPKITPHAIGCVERASDGQQMWLWPNESTPFRSTPGDTVSLPLVRLGGEELFRVCNGKCERRTFFACNTCPDTGPGTDRPTEQECANSAPELYLTVESTSTLDCYCRKGTAQKKGADEIVRWQAYVHCETSSGSGSGAAPETVQEALDQIGYFLIDSYAACARCKSNEKTPCSPHRAVQTRESCDVARQALSFAEPLFVRRALQPGCFVATTEQGQEIFWGGSEDQYVGHLQAAPDNDAWTRICSAISPATQRPKYKLVVQTSGQCITPAPRTQCNVNDQASAQQYAFSGCVTTDPILYDWNLYTFASAPTECTPLTPCLCVDIFNTGDEQCYRGQNCIDVAEHFGYVTPSSLTGTTDVCVFNNGYLTETTAAAAPSPCMQVDANVLKMRVRHFNLISFDNNVILYMSMHQCMRISSTYNTPFLTNQLKQGLCAFDFATKVFYLTLSTSETGVRLLGIEASVNQNCETPHPATISECDAEATLVLGSQFKASSIFDPTLPSGCIIDTRDARMRATGLPVWNKASTNVSCTDTVQCICGRQPTESKCPQVLREEPGTDERALQVLVVVIAGLALILVATTIPIRSSVGGVAPAISFSDIQSTKVPKYSKFDETKFL
ncbi:MAG: hypothetical protein CL678_01225 [Bdellovibrionaceae bacterium]|nr:hypothetical protein [Pseudobdellovibrionaceae bacterium]